MRAEEPADAPGRNGHVLMVDGHVHAWRTQDLSNILSAAHANFSTFAGQYRRRSWTGVLLLADPEGMDASEGLIRLAERPSPGWCAPVEPTASLSGWTAPGATPFVILRGYQIASSEGLEVLAFGVQSRPPRRSIADVVRGILAEQGLAILPWGAGKWLGTRRRHLLRLIEQGIAGGFLLGDSGGRPWFWTEGRVFEEARNRRTPILPGSDPLPIPGDYRRVGSIGALVDAEPGALDSEAGLIRHLARGGWLPFGHPMGAVRFVINQARLRSARRAARLD